MAREMLPVSCLVVLLVVVPGSKGSYPSAAGQENVYQHGLKVVHAAESSRPFRPSQEVFEHHQEQEYQHPVLVQQHHQYVSVPEQQQQHHLQSQQQYLVQSGYNVGSHQEHPVQQHHLSQPQQQSKQRHTALPYNNQRLHVKVDHPGAGQGLVHSITPSAQHLRQQLAQEPKQDYRSLIPKSIAPKLNPLHHSFHQKRNFVPLHHITRQVPIPVGKGNQGSHHANGKPQPLKVALAPPQPKHIAG